MAPLTATQEPWDTEEQWGYDGDYDEEYDGKYGGDNDGDYDGEYDNVAPIEPVAASTLSEADVGNLLAETIIVASLGPALPPSTTPESIFGTTQFTTRATLTEGIIEKSLPVITEADAAAAPTVSTTTSTTPKEGKLVYKTLKSKPAQTMSKEASSWDRRQRQRARRIKKEREARARAFRRINFAKKMEEERARKAADRAAFLEETDYQPPILPKYSKRAPPSPLEAHAPAWTGQGVKEEEQRWRAGEGRVSAADREEAAREIARVAKLIELERQKGIEEAAARVATQDDGVGNPYLDHNSYDPAQAHVEEAAGGARFLTSKGVGDAAPELGNVGVGIVILLWVALVVAILRCQRRRKGGPNWGRERRGRTGFLAQGRKKRQSQEQQREKLDV